MSTTNLAGAASPTALTLKDCPLLPEADELIEQFNRVADRYSVVRREFPDLNDRPEFAGLAGELSAVRNRLTRRRYLVGFVGTTQAGKSTTFNSVLGVADADAPALSGKGQATTSAITRLHRSPESRNTLRLRYSTPAAYRRKRERLCDVVGLNHQMPDAELLPKLQAKRAEMEAGRGSGDALLADVEALELLLLSHAQFGARYLTEPPTVDDRMPYARRGEFINHMLGPGGKPVPSPNLLLAEVELGLATDAVPDALEMIDLPGLGSQGSLDTILTTEFFAELDAGLVFVLAKRVGDESIERILTRLRRCFEGKPAGRLWVIFTQLDSLSANVFTGEDTAADVFLRLLERHRIPASQALLTSNEIYRRRDPATGRVDPTVAAAMLKVSTSEPIPPKFRDHADLARAWGHLLVDGGIGRLRELIRSDLSVAVREEIRRWAGDKLASVADRIEHEHAMRQRSARLSNQDRQDANACRRAVMNLLVKLDGRMPLAETLASELTEALRRRLEEVGLDEAALRLLDPDKLAEEFRRDARSLEDKLTELVDSLLIGRFYDELGRDFAGLPAVAVLDSPDLATAWRGFHRRDVEDRTWRRELMPTFDVGDLFEPETLMAGHVTPLDAAALRELMAEKIETAARQAVHAVRVQLRRRLRALERELDRLVRTADTAA